MRREKESREKNIKIWMFDIRICWQIYFHSLCISEQVHMLDQLDVLLILHAIYFLYHLHFQYEFHNSECSENISRYVNILSFKFVDLFLESEKELIAIFENIANVVNMTYFIFASLEIYSIRFALSPNLNKKSMW